MHPDQINHVLSSINSFDEFENLKREIQALEMLARMIAHKHNLPDMPMTLFPEGTNIVFKYGHSKVIKIFPPLHLDQFQSELLVLQHLQGKLSVPTPLIEFHGDVSGWPYIIMSKVDGTLLEEIWEELGHDNKVTIMNELGTLIREVHALPTNGLEEIDCNWNQFIQQQIDQCTERHRSKGLSQTLIDQIPTYIEPIKESLMLHAKPVLLTGEYTPMNFLVNKVDSLWHIAGLIDFGDCMLGLPEYDLLGPGAFLIQGDKTLLKAFLTSYGYSTDMLTEKLSHKLTSLMLLHKYSNLHAQLRIESWNRKVSNIKELEDLVWGLQ
jgi:hygromycin-B 7''-O-kinase